MFITRYSLLKIASLALITVALVIMAGFRLEMPSPSDAIDYTATEVRNEIAQQCGDLIANRVRIVGSIRTQSGTEILVLQSAYINDDPVGEFAFFVFSSFTFYDFVVPMIDMIGTSIVNCERARDLN